MQYLDILWICFLKQEPSQYLIFWTSLSFIPELKQVELKSWMSNLSNAEQTVVLDVGNKKKGTWEEKKIYYVYLLRRLKIHFTSSTLCAILLTFPLVYQMRLLHKAVDLSGKWLDWPLARDCPEISYMYRDPWSLFWSFVSSDLFYWKSVKYVQASITVFHWI